MKLGDKHVILKFWLFPSRIRTVAHEQNFMMSAEKTKEASAVEDLYKAFGVLADAKDKAGEVR